MALKNYESVYEFFECLNREGTEYVVMRNYEEMDKENFFCEGHEDIDVLCKDVDEFVKNTDVICKMDIDDDIHFMTFIGEKPVPIDLRHQGDDYYDEKWEEDILKRREKAQNGNWYVMSQEDYYYSLVYHVILQKKTVNTVYLKKLCVMAEHLGIVAKTVEEHIEKLKKYMDKSGYDFVKPKDASVPYQEQYIGGKGEKEKSEKKNLKTEIREILVGFTKRINIYHAIKEKRYDIQRDSFNLCNNRFKDLDKLASKINKKYGEDVYEQLAQRRIYNYMQRYVGEIEEIKQEIEEKIKKYPVQKGIENSIFTMWWQGKDEMPPVVRACIGSLDKLEKRVVFLDKDNIRQYVWLPDYIWEKYEKGQIGRAHFSDIIRTVVLVMYGGVWIDATVYVADKVPYYMTEGFFVFTQSPQLKECRSYGNWWISAPKNTELILEQLSYLFCYWKNEEYAMNYYIYHIFFKKIIDSSLKYQEMIKKMPVRITDQTHSLFKKYNEEYDVKEWNELKKISPVFKCSYKKKGLTSYNTYFCRLCNETLDKE